MSGRVLSGRRAASPLRILRQGDTKRYGRGSAGGQPEPPSRPFLIAGQLCRLDDAIIARWPSASLPALAIPADEAIRSCWGSKRGQEPAEYRSNSTVRGHLSLPQYYLNVIPSYRCELFAGHAERALIQINSFSR